MSNAPQQQQWGSRLGVILAVAGSAVGLGNFLRFPGNAAENGGGAFMIPYFLALVLVGIPIGWAEWAMGRYGGRKGFHSAPAILGVWCKGAWGRYAGMFGVLIPLGVYFYYVLIESWCLYYFWKYCTGGIGVVAGSDVIDAQVPTTHGFFGDVVGAAEHGALFTGANGMHPVLLAFGITVVLNVWFVYRGLSKGIETVCKYAMPVMALLGLVILLRVLTLDAPAATVGQTVNDGLGYLWNPNFEKLTDFKTWVAATGQIFFSLSVGFGVIINYASYMKKKDDVVLSGLTASATNEFFEVVLGGLITVTASVVFVGAFLTSQATGGSMSLGFKTLPMVFAQMPGGNFFGAAFFLILFLAAITSSLSMLQPTKAFFEEALGIDKVKSTTLVTLWGLAGNAFVLWYSKGLTALDTIDFWVGSVFIMVVAAVQIVAFGWIFGLDRGIAEAHEGAQMRIPKFFQFVIKYVAPAYLFVILIGFCTNNMPGYIDTLLGKVSTTAKADLKTHRQIGNDFPDEPKRTYSWKQVDGPPVTLSDAKAKAPSFPFQEPANAKNFDVKFELAVSDGTNSKTYPIVVGVDVESPGAARLTWVFLIVTIVALLAITAAGAKRWRREGRDLDGLQPAAD
ncbi:MAG: sodium-dependent transporter [Planctomycetes bacterium]|nr:sodium-dependent transporter [Planctomycetota bacterium]